jgi:molybdate transport repressor ModE-like protein
MRQTKNLLALEDLQLPAAIGTNGALTGAARKLQLDHSTAFRRLGAMEQRLGARLFERARDGYTPTPAGEAALTAAASILEEISELERRLAGEDFRPSGTARVTMPDTLVPLITPIFAGLRAEHPEITIELTVSNAFFSLTKRDADIAVRPAAAAPDNLVGRRLAALATAPYAATGYLVGKSRQSALFEHDWLGFEDSLQHLASAKWLAARVKADRIVYRASSLLALKIAADAAMGVAALPCYLGDSDRALERVQPPLKELEVSLWLLTHPDLRRVARIRTVLDFLARAFAKRRDFIEGRGAFDARGFRDPQSGGRASAGTA